MAPVWCPLHPLLWGIVIVITSLPIWKENHPINFFFHECDGKMFWYWKAHSCLLHWLNWICCLFFQTPHPLYKPSNDFVPCKDPLCASLQPSEDYICENPDQCDYEINYADQYSTFGVLLNDVYLLNFTNGVQLKVRMALGLVYHASFVSLPLYHFSFVYDIVLFIYWRFCMLAMCEAFLLRHS